MDFYDLLEKVDVESVKKVAYDKYITLKNPHPNCSTKTNDSLIKGIELTFRQKCLLANKINLNCRNTKILLKALCYCAEDIGKLEAAVRNLHAQSNFMSIEMSYYLNSFVTVINNYRHEENV